MQVVGQLRDLVTQQPLACTGPVTVKIFDVESFLLSPRTAVPAATCPSDNAGNFTCSGAGIGSAPQALVMLAEDPSGACISPTVAVVAACDPTCAQSDAGKDNVLSGADLQPLLMAPAHLLANLEATAPAPELGSLVDTGAVLNLVVDRAQHPFVNAKPWLPANCNAADPKGGTLLQCRSVILANDGSAESHALTDTSGLFLAQVTKHTAGALADVTIDISTVGDAIAGYGAFDCSGGSGCFAPLPSLPFRTDELGTGIKGVVTLNVVVPESAKNGACDLATHAIAAGQSAEATCP